VAAALATGGLEGALAAWRSAVSEGDSRWSLAEYELQYVARQCTLAGRHDVAAALFRANRDRFPESPLAWYELGRALAAGGQPDDAKRALRHAIALEPGSSNPSYDVLADLDR
jgi:predicted Zn-dependent protease